MTEMMLTRLKPFNPKRGYTLRRFSVFGIRFDHDRGWYRVDQNVATYLKTVHCDNNNPDSPLAFDVYAEEEARGVVERERLAKLKRGEVKSPIDTASETRLDSRRQREIDSSHRASADHVGALDLDGPGGDVTTGDLPGSTDSQPETNSADVSHELPPPPDASLEIPSPDPAPLPAAATPPPPPPDRLTKLDGVGDATEEKFYEVGLRTYVGIANADKTAIEAIVGGKAKAIQKQAAKLAKG